MKGNPFRVLGRPWAVVPILLVACWTTTFLGPVTLLIVPAVVAGIVASIRRKSWVALCLLLALNPLGVFFLCGLTSYMRGAPSLRFVGLPRIESFNLDRSSRCFRNGGGCLVSGNEWVFISPHNSALRLMALLFGPPSKSYDGPYPTKDEAMAQTAKASETPVRQFLAGSIAVDGKTFQLGGEVVAKLVDGLRLFSLRHPEDSGFDTKVRAALYQERCLIVRLSEAFALSGGSDDMDNDLLVFFDTKNMRPFAYFTIKGIGATRFPPVAYVPEHDK